MGIDFSSPWLLLLLLPACYVLIRWWRGERHMPASRKAVILALRTLVFLLLILTLAGTQLLTPVKGKTVVFVVDRSASMKDDPRLAAFLREAVSRKQPQDQYAVVAVGEKAAVDQPLTTRDEVQPLGVEVNRNATHLAEGIRLAAAMIPSQARGKVVVLTDGVATGGDAERETRLAVDRGIAVEAVSMQQPQGDEVLLAAVQVPERLYAGEEFAISVDVESTLSTGATLRLYEGNREAGSQKVAIEKGKNRFVFSQKAIQQGFHRFRVEIEPERDTVRANNQATAYTGVAGAPVVLVVEGHPGAASNLTQALKAGNMAVEVKDARLLPKELDGYKPYASLVLADVPATQIGDEDMERIRTAVRDLGMGLIMTGGGDSFGMGGWFQTPIEEALPVQMDLKGKENLPSLGLELVIDKSGSMTGDARGVDKMELAKEAAIRATTMMNGQDQIGVIAFDGSPWEVVAPRSVTQLDEIQRQIGSIYADGGTDIYPALQLAYERIKTMKTQRKHVILLTDGQSGQDDDYAGLLQQMAGENITVSTVAVGEGADTQLLQMISEMGKGRYYFAGDAESIPKIFSKETALASRTFIVEKPQEPIRTGSGGWASLKQAVPPLLAYIATTPKQTAETPLVSVDEDPVLARWQYGLGRTVAWTSDLEGKWAPDWVSWGGSSRFWNELVAWTLPQVSEGNWKTETQLVGGTGRVTVTLPDNAPMPQELEAVVISQQMQREAIRLKPTAPGVLAGDFAAADPGSYLVQIVEKAGGQIVANQTAGLTVAYSPEFGLPRDGEQELRNWLIAGGGSLIEQPGEAFAGSMAGKWETQPIGEWLLMLAALLWPLDVASRRLQLPDQWWAKLTALWRKRPPAQSDARGQAVLTRLGERKAAGAQRAATGKDAEQNPKSAAGVMRPAEQASGSPAHTTAAAPKAARQQERGANEDAPADETLNRLLAAKKRRTK